MIADIVRNVRLIWRLFTDRHVPVWTKAVPLLALAYVIFPLDFIPDALLGLGQLDDLTIVLLGLKAFISLSPADIVAQYRNKLRQETRAGRRTPSTLPIVCSITNGRMIERTTCKFWQIPKGGAVLARSHHWE